MAVAAKVRLDLPDKEGKTRRDKLDTVTTVSGQRPPELAEGDAPEDGLLLWTWFWELAQGRRNSGFGPERLTHTDIKAWAELMGERPSPWQVQALMSMDAAFLATITEETKAANPRD